MLFATGDFMADVLTKEQRHKNMQHIRSKDTQIELMLRKALWEKGYRYRKNYNELPGKPDIALTKYNIAIFCDSEFFHGKDWNELKRHLAKSNNSEFWIKKIEANIQHDTNVNLDLKSLGWTVLRFWGNDIKKNLSECLATIDEAVFAHRIESEITDRQEESDE